MPKTYEMLGITKERSDELFEKTMLALRNSPAFGYTDILNITETKEEVIYVMEGLQNMMKALT